MVPPKLHNYGFETVPQPGLNGRRGYVPRGKMLGGSSGINAMTTCAASARTTTVGPPKAPPAGPGMTCCPTSSAARPTNAWARRCTAKTAPCMSAICAATTLPATLAGGPRASGSPHQRRLQRRDAGRPRVCQTTQHLASAGAPRALPAAPWACAPTCKVRCGVQVQRVLFDGRRAVGVEVREGGLLAPTARPARGGAGGRGHPVAAVADAVGRGTGRAPAGAGPARAAPPARRRRQPARPSGLRLRLRIRRPEHAGHLARRQRPVRARRGALPPRATRLCWQGNIAEAGGFLRTSPAHATPNIQLHLLVALVENHARRLHWGHGITCHVCVLPQEPGQRAPGQPTGRRRAAHRPGFLPAPDDLPQLVEGYKLTRKLMHAPALKAHWTRELWTARPRPTTKSKP